MAEPTTGFPALKTLARALLRRLGGVRRPPGAERAHIEMLGQTVAAKREIAGAVDFRSLELKPEMRAWSPTGLLVSEGEQVTLFAGGKVSVSRLADISMGAKTVLWFRIGRDGPMSKIVNTGQSFTAAQSGELLLALQPPGGWMNAAGHFNPAIVWRGARGAIQVLAVKWVDAAEPGLKALLPFDRTGVVKNAMLQCRYPRHAPQGWRYLWSLGEGEIYAPGGGRGHITCHTDRDVGILQIPADFELDETVKLSWKWRASLLPSSLREDIQPTHDYLSIAVEFDNGLDLTYMWSSELPVDTVFQCPLPWWIERETHWVLRSNPRDLDKWLSEERHVLADYMSAIGGQAPKRIVAVWLIANSVFQRGEGKCEYSDILLRGADRQMELQ
ncbi:MAG TPA: DUF3047 domain-containing protein [Alphaproteobacteria bacterium]|nr:DUF3047 domain-containing protein [Alphaproteobacteria bacterium]